MPDHTLQLVLAPHIEQLILSLPLQYELDQLMLQLLHLHSAYKKIQQIHNLINYNNIKKRARINEIRLSFDNITYKICSCLRILLPF
jgi:hypothetical protein